MFLENYENADRLFNKISKASTDFAGGYRFWSENLFERTMRLFEWVLPESMPQKNVEQPMLTNGTCGATNKYDGLMRPFNGNYAGEPTVFFDEYKSYAVRSPKFSGIFKIGSEIVIGRNNSLADPIYPLIHRYAILLAHVETSLVGALINGRDSGGIPVASTQAGKTALENYRNSLCNGKVMPIQDPAFSTVQFIGVAKNSEFTVADLIEARDRLLASFYQDIGVRTVWNKKGNMIASEVEGADPMLLFNIRDMLKCREKFAEDINNFCDMKKIKLPVTVSVKLSPELEYVEGGNEDEQNKPQKTLEVK